MIVDPDFPDHWKTRTLVGLLEDEAAPIYVLRIWAHCQNRRQVRFDNLTPEALKALCHFPGPANKLESSLVTSGFVRRDSKVLVVHAWDEYNSSLIASWNNGKKGGRPPTTKPVGSNGETQHKPMGSRVEKNGEEELREEKKPPPPNPQTKNGNSVAGGGHLWNVDEEAHARLALKGSGFKRYDDLIGQLKDLGVGPQDVVSACKEYEANRDRFNSPGAIAEKLRTGYWPADGVVSTEEASQKKAATNGEKRRLYAESIRRRLINDGENDARNWDDAKVVARARAKGWIE